MTPSSQFQPSTTSPDSQSSSPSGLSMFGMQGQGQQAGNQPSQSPDSDQSPTGMAKAVASARTSLTELAKQYPEFADIVDKFNQQMVDKMYKSMTKQDAGKEGQGEGY